MGRGEVLPPFRASWFEQASLKHVVLPLEEALHSEALCSSSGRETDLKVVLPLVPLIFCV